MVGDDKERTVVIVPPRAVAVSRVKAKILDPSSWYCETSGGSTSSDLLICLKDGNVASFEQARKTSLRALGRDNESESDSSLFRESDSIRRSKRAMTKPDHDTLDGKVRGDLAVKFGSRRLR